jgi:hypothetical protein
MQEIQALFDAGDYNGVLRDVAHVLTLGGKAGEPYDKYELLVLRGETQLRLKLAPSAAAAFKQAAAQTKDVQKAAMATATDLLIRRSPQLQYTPRKTGGGQHAEPIGIVDAKSRKQAMEALYVDERDAAAEAMAQGKKAVSLPQIAAAVKAIQAHSLVALDRATRGNVDDVKEATGDLRARTRELILAALDQMTRQEADISNAADKLIRIPSGRAGEPDMMQRRGLQGSDHQNLVAIVQNCKQIAQASVELMSVLSDLPADATDLVAKADALRASAEARLKKG